MSNFALTAQPGIVSDDTTFSSQGRYSDGNNVRFYQGRPQTIGGVALPGITGPYTGVTKMLAYTVSGATRIASAGDDLISIDSGVADYDITPVGWASGRHTLAMWGDVLLACNSGGKLYQSVAGATATEITQSPDEITAMLVTQTRQVMALGANEASSGTFNPRAIRISDVEDLTDWTPSASNLSDEVILEGQAPIVGGCLLGEYVVVWTTGAMFLGTFTGDVVQPWRFDRVAQVGLVALDAFAAHGTRVYFMAPDLRVYTYSPGQGPSHIPCPISREFTTNCWAVDHDQIFGFYNSRFGEAWFFYLDQRGGGSTPNRYIAFAASESETAQQPVWFRGQLVATAAVESALLGTEFSGYSTSIAATISVAGGPFHLARFDCGLLQTGFSPFHIQTADQYFDESQTRMMIRSVVPDFEDGSVNLYVYVRSRPQDTPVTKGPYAITDETSKKDFRASGKIIAMKFDGTSGTFWRLGKPLFDVVPMGER
jgi:hypothetical protein